MLCHCGKTECHQDELAQIEIYNLLTQTVQMIQGLEWASPEEAHDLIRFAAKEFRKEFRNVWEKKGVDSGQIQC